jgi:hypothetical protein
VIGRLQPGAELQPVDRIGPSGPYSTLLLYKAGACMCFLPGRKLPSDLPLAANPCGLDVNSEGTAVDVIQGPRAELQPVELMRHSLL